VAHDTHIERLRLIRILTSVGRLTLSEVREILSALEDGNDSPRSAESASAIV